MHNSQRNRNRLQLLRQSASSGRLLEIGCGQGEFLCMAANHYDVEGVDISTHAVRTLRCSDDFRVRRADIQTTLLPENAFSAVAAFNVLEHLTEPAPVIARIHAALHPGGTLVGSVPYNAALLGRIHTGLTNLFDRTHVSTYRPRRWRSLFEQAGFCRVDFFGEINFGKNACRYLRSPLWPALAFNLMFVCTRGSADAETG